MNQRYKLLRLCDGSQASKKNWEDYKKARNNVTKLLRSAETQYWKDEFANANITLVNFGKLLIVSMANNIPAE